MSIKKHLFVFFWGGEQNKQGKNTKLLIMRNLSPCDKRSHLKILCEQEVKYKKAENTETS